MVQSKTKIAGKTHRVSSRVKKQKVSEPLTKKKAIEAVVKQESNPVVLSESHELSIVEMAQRIVETGSIKGNEFSRMGYEIASKIIEYERIRKECDIQDAAHSKTIYRLAKPFLKGHFTLAVVGKMSAGKSTFINSLIGDNLFPTGHFQTTSTLTFIENGDEAKMVVLFCDGHTESIANDTIQIKERLKQLVAVPEQYSNLPINDINILISGDDDIAEILKKKEGIEEMTGLPSVDESMWKIYVKEHPKHKIAKEVHISYPLPIEYQGWRIIDTPGLGATGGIQIATQMLFDEKDKDNNKIVDAIVFLHSGTDNIEDEAARRFMSMIVKGLTEDAKKRLFFVITKASKEEFRNNKEATLRKARDLYAKSFGISEDRFTYIDSLLERFNNSLEDRKFFDEKECPSNWDFEEWDQMTNLYTPIKKQLIREGIKPEDESIERVMKDWSNFDHLKSLLNRFMRGEKSIVFNSICALIAEDCKGFTKNFQYQISVLEGKRDIQEELNKLKEKQIEYNEKLNEITRNNTKSNINEEYKFVDDRIRDFSNKDSILSIRTTYLQLITEAVVTENNIFNRIKTEFKGYLSSDSSSLFEPIDLDELELKSEKKVDELERVAEENTRDVVWVTDYEKPKKEIIKKRSKDDEVKITYPDKKRDYKVDLERKRRAFATYVIHEARRRKEEFIEEINIKINKFNELVGEEITSRQKYAESQLLELEKALAEREKHMANLKAKIEIIENRKC